MYSDENKSSAVAAILNRFDYVLIDTCSLMDPACPVWMDALHNAKDYRKKREPIIVPRRCYDELKKHSRDKSADSKRIAGKRGLKILRKAKWDRLLAVAKKDKNENFADNAIYVKVCADRLFSKILIITQDKSLASDLLALNKLRSQQGRPVEVYKLVSDGKMVPNLGESDDERREHRAGGRPKPQTASPKTKPAQPAKGGTTPADIQAADARLCAVLSNPNYPEEKKRLDAEAQLKILLDLASSIKAKLKLKMDVDRIKAFLNYGNVSAKPQAKQEPKKQEAPKKAEPVKKEAPKDPKNIGDRLYYGAGKDFKQAVEDCAAHYGILFREPSVRYFAQAHGPFDLTVKDKDAIIKEGLAAIKGNEKVAYSHNGIPMWAQRASEERYKYWIDVNFKVEKAEAPKSEPKPEPKKETKPAPKAKAEAKEPAPKAKPATEEATPKAKPEAKEAAPKQEPKKAPAKKAEPKPEAPKKATKAKQAPKEEPKAKPAPKEAKPEAKPEPKAKPAPKKAAPKKEPKPEAAKESKPAKKAEPKAKEAPKPEAKAPAKKAPAKKSAKPEAPASEDFKKAQAADKRLSAVLPNPNYALKDKIADIKAQRALLMTLSENEFSKLKYGPKQIDEWLKANQGFEEGQGE